jgi:ABC-type amino acid transport substrate-binding protein/two-component sensor histidine kinase
MMLKSGLPEQRNPADLVLIIEAVSKCVTIASDLIYFVVLVGHNDCTDDRHCHFVTLSAELNTLKASPMVDRHNKTYSDTSWLWYALLYTVIALLALLALLAFSPVALAQTSTPHTSNSSQLQLELTPEEQAWLNEHPDIALGAPTSYPPMVIERGDGTHVGVLVDFFEEVSEMLGHRVRLHIEDPWTKVQEQAEKREIDGLALGGKSPGRAALYNETAPLFNTYFSVFAPSREEPHIKQFSDLDGKRIGYKAGARPTRSLLEKLSSAELKSYDSHESMTQALLSKEIDVVVAWVSYDHWRKETLQGTIDNILLIDEYPIEMVSHIRKDWPELVSILNKVILAMQKDELPRITNKWFGEWPNRSLREHESQQLDIILTQKEQAWLKAHPEITVGTTASYPPHVIKNPNGTYTGVNIDFYEQISQLLNTRFKLYVGEVWSDVQKKAENRELDGLSIVGRDPNRDLHYNATDLIYPSYFSVFADSKDDLQIERFSDLDGMRIGYKRGARPARTRLEKLPSAIIKPYDDHESMTQALLTKEIDVIVAWMSYDHWRKKTLQGTIDKIYLIKEYPLEMVGYIRKDWPELIPIVNKAIAVLQQNRLPRIIDKWFGEWPQRPEDEEPKSRRIIFTAKEQAWMAQNRTVRVRITNWPPYMIVKGNAPPQGIAVEYLKLVEERTGLTLTHEVTDQSFAGFLESMKQRKGPDMAALISPTPEREEYLTFSESYSSAPYVIFIRKQDTLILDVNDLAGKKLAVLRGSVLQQQLVRDYPQINLVMFDSDEKALQAVATGQSDAYIGILTVASHIIQSKGFSDLQVAAAGPFEDVALAMGIRNDWPELASIINKVLVSITEEEKVAIRQKYLAIEFEQGIKEVELLKWAQVAAGVVLGVILMFVLWNRILKKQVRERTSELKQSNKTLQVDITERKRAEQKNIDYQQRLKSLTSQLTLAEEQERRRIAANLHDDVGQNLAITRLQLASVIHGLDDADSKEQLDEISSMLHKAIRDTRQLIFDLSSPTMHELGLAAAINEWAGEQLKRTQGLEFTLESKLVGTELDEEQLAIMFRNTRELLTNTIKHARAKKLSVTLENVDQEIRVTVQDDGIGFDPQRIADGVNLEGGFGVFSVEERMKDLGGKLVINSQPNQGCTMTMSLPENQETRSLA